MEEILSKTPNTLLYCCVTSISHFSHLTRQTHHVLSNKGELYLGNRKENTDTVMQKDMLSEIPILMQKKYIYIFTQKALSPHMTVHFW